MSRIAALPFFVLMMGVGAAAMLLPAAHALRLEDFDTARIFFYGTILFGIITALIGIATYGLGMRNPARGQLVALLAAFTLLPLMFALPFYVSIPRGGFLNAWFEMVSAFTTTGATIWDSPTQLPPSLHLWRALVGWLGGMLIWIVALAIFAPMAIGGFEVRAQASVGGGPRFSQISRTADPTERLLHFSGQLAPIYIGLTLVLWFALAIAGEVPFIAFCHAMSVLSTSGISPVGGLTGATAGLPGEALMLLFLVFALSRRTFSSGRTGDERRSLKDDPELQMAAAILALVPLALFFRHWVGVGETGTDNLGEALKALWGAVFTVTSFLTTTGFESREWLAAADWSGLQTPGLILVGLAVVGGGIGTTAGGVKLLRVYALYKHGRREVDRLIHPNSVGGAGAEARRIRRQGATIAFVFFMLFALSVAAVMLALSFTGVQFETAMVLTVSALSNTGPLAAIAAETPISYSGVPGAAKVVLAAAMVLGRLEALAIIALLNPEFWRR